MSVETLDHAALAASRLTGLYQDKAKWKAFVSMVASCFDDLETVLPILTKLDDLDSKDSFDSYILRGVLLDTFGARIGQPRRIANAIPVLLFGWDDDATALAWSEDDASGLTGGSWIEDGQSVYSDAVMDDATYRIALQMRRLKNKTKTLNLETIISALLFLFPDVPDLGPYALVLTDVTGTILFGIGREPTDLEIALLRDTGAFPKPAGVSIGAYWWPTGTAVFGFDDDPDTSDAGWFEEGDPDSGGIFAEEF